MRPIPALIHRPNSAQKTPRSSADGYGLGTCYSRERVTYEAPPDNDHKVVRLHGTTESLRRRGALRSPGL